MFLVAPFPIFDCADKKNGLYYDIEYCNVYWECRQGLGKKFECPTGRAYNHVTQMCDSIKNVDCGRKEVTQVSSETTVVTTTDRPTTISPTLSSTTSNSNENTTTIYNSTLVTVVSTTITTDIKPNANVTGNTSNLILFYLNFWQKKPEYNDYANVNDVQIVKLWGKRL